MVRAIHNMRKSKYKYSGQYLTLAMVKLCQNQTFNIPGHNRPTNRNPEQQGANRWWGRHKFILGTMCVLISCVTTPLVSVHGEQTRTVFANIRLESVIIMNFLSVKRLDSLGRSSSISSLNTSLDGVNLDDSSYSSGSEDTLEDEGIHLEIDIEDGR